MAMAGMSMGEVLPVRMIVSGVSIETFAMRMRMVGHEAIVRKWCLACSRGGRLLGTLTTSAAEAIDGAYRPCHDELATASRAVAWGDSKQK